MADENKRIVELATAKATYEIGGGRVGLFGYENEAATLRFQFGASPTANILYVARRDAAQTFSGDQTFSGAVIGTAGVSSLASFQHRKTGAHDAARVVLTSRATSDTNSRFVLREDGLMLWGGGGVQDVNLYRSAADVLKTDDNFDAASLRVAGVPRISGGGAGTFTGVTDSSRTPGRILFADTSGLHADDSNLLWDNTRKDFGIGSSRARTGSTVAASEGAEILVASGAYIAGLHEIRLNAANRVERMWVWVASNQYDDACVLSIVNHLSYTGANSLGMVRVRKSADGATHYLTVVTSNLGGATPVLNILSRTMDTSVVIGGSLPGGLTVLRALAPNRSHGVRTSGSMSLGSNDIDGTSNARLSVFQKSNAAGGGEIFLDAAGTADDENSGKLLLGSNSRVIGRTDTTTPLKLQVKNGTSGLWETLAALSPGNAASPGFDISTGPLRLAGVQRISSGGAGTLTTLSTTGLATLAQATVSDITADQVVTTTTTGRLTGDAGLTRGRTGSITRALNIGDYSVVDDVFYSARQSSTKLAGLALFDSAQNRRWTTVIDGTDYRVGRYTNSATKIDDPIQIAAGSAGLITIGGSTGSATSFTGAIQTSGVTRISSGGAGTLTTLDTTGAATIGGDAIVTGNVVTNAIVAAGEFRHQKVQTFSGNANGTATFSLYRYTGTGGHTLAFGSATLAYGIYTVVNAGTGSLTIDAFSTETINGAETVSLAAGTTATIVSNGTNYTAVIGGLVGSQFTQGPAVTRSGIVTNSTLLGTGKGALAIPAGRLNGVGEGIDIYLCGHYTTDASAGTATIRIRLGTTTIRTIGPITLDNNVTNGLWWIRGRLSCKTTGASGTIGGQLTWEHQASTVGGGADAIHIANATSVADVTLDFTSGQAFDVDWTASDAGTSITCTCASVQYT